MVDIVQLVERQIVDLVVAGSSPVIHPIRRIELLALCDFFILIYYISNGLEPGFAPVGRTALERSRLWLKTTNCCCFLNASPLLSNPFRRIELLALCDFFIQIANLLLISCSFIPCEALCVLIRSLYFDGDFLF